MLPEKLAFVDIETTGPRVTRDRVIEIGILRVEDGKLVRTYQTLINPETHVPPFIEQYTGISKEELVTAPTFSEVKDEILDALDGCIFVAHNVRFDYGFLKNEFARLELPFSPQHFCTVKLSRLLYPQHPRHSIDALIERFAITCPNRHRALDDARVMWEFIQIAQQHFAPEDLEQALKKALRRPSVPTTITQETLQALPESPGVYIFYGPEGYPLYVGKSKNIRERVLSHFANDYASSKEMHMCQQVQHIDALPTAGELGALLKESYLIKKLQPLYNRKLRRMSKLVVVKKYTTNTGYDSVRVEVVTEICPDDMPTIVGVFKSQRQAKEFVRQKAEEHHLCHKLLELEHSTKACFGYQLEKCRGACLQEELPVSYNVRFITAFGPHVFKPWPFPGPIVIKESSDINKKEEGFVIDKWCLLGAVQEDTELQDVTAQSDYLFDLDTYKILQHYVFSPKYQPSILSLGR